MLIEGGYVVTNAHVVWPFQEVRVVFPNGSEHLEAPVLGWDLMGDLAVIGPLQTSISPVELVDGENLAIGSDVFLIGYPGELGGFPQPTITRGLVSRLREWEPIGMSYFQTDATIAGGQSGGVLVSEDGEVIGISGFSFTEAGFGLVASAADVSPRATRLIAGENVDGLGDRRLPVEGGQLEFDVRLGSPWDTGVFVVNEPVGTLVDVELESEGDVAIIFADVFGNPIEIVDNGTSGIESGSFETDLAAPYFVLAFVGLASRKPADLRLRSNLDLTRYEDSEDGVALTIGETVGGALDYPGDHDVFEVDLAEAETVEISVDSLNIDPFLIVDFPGATIEQIIQDDDSGGGLFGLNAELIYRAPHSGSYLIVVKDAAGASVGGYFLTVAQAPPGADAVSPPTIATVDSPFGPMAVYESPTSPLSIQYPADWIEQPAVPELGVTALFAGDQNATFTIAEEDLVAIGFGEMTLEEYVDLVVSIMKSVGPDLEVVREPITTAQGLPAERLVSTLFGGAFVATRLIYLHEGRVGFNSTYLAPKGRHEELEELIEYSFSTFQVESATSGP